MKTDNNILKIISNETLNSIHNIDIVTPSIYTSLFSKHASEHEMKIEDEDKLTDTLLDNKIIRCQTVQEKNTDSVLQLSLSTTKAISAIQNKDEDTLNQVLQETKELKKELEKLKEAVYKDELTNVYNRKYLNDTFLDDSKEKFTFNGTLAIIDLNFFKLVNDTYGHILGDKVLVFIAAQLKKTQESVIRYGGDEFIIIFKDTDQDTAFKVINEIREKIISKKLKAGDVSFRVSFSIGTYEFEEGHVLSNTIALADKNMYDDKVKIKQRITGIE